jgi:hypothetical protein
MVLGGFVGLVVAIVALVLSVLANNPLGLLGAALAVVGTSVVTGTAMVESWDRQPDRHRYRLTA